MPLPENNSPWPPPEYAAQLRDMRIDEAWYSGDKAKLRKVYQPTPDRDERGRGWRIWERGRRLDQRDNRLHVPLAGDIAATSADLLFSEPPTFNVKATATQDRLNQIYDEGGMANTLLEAAEVCAGLGGVALRATWNSELAKRPIATAVHADCIIPEWKTGILTALSFWREVLHEGNTVLRHIERHESGRVLHALYEGTPDNLGTKVPLTEHEDTADLVDSLDADGDQITTGIKKLTAVYIPNMRPNRKFRGSYLGRSDWQNDGTRDHFMSLDEVYTSWLRDIRLAKSRIIVPKGWLTSEGAGQGASFDDDREVWSEINAAPTTGEGLTLNQFEIRVEAHEQSWKAITREAVRSAGYSAQSFGLGERTAATATEVVAEERRSMITRDRKGRYWIPELADFSETVLLLDVRLGFSSVPVERPAVEFGDSVSEDPRTTAETVEFLNRAMAASTETKVRIVNPDRADDDAWVRQETERILKENGLLVSDPTQVGAEGPPAPPGGGGE